MPLNSNGIQITIPASENMEAHTLRIEVISEDIFRISASPTDSIPEVQSLMIQDSLPKAPSWERRETNDSIGLITSKSQAWVSKITGGIAFKDESGKLLLKETPGGKAFLPITADQNHPLFTITQRFESPRDESLYGLGQQQTGLFDYKGYQVDLTQYNGVVAVPFLTSSREYSILWDNNSITKVGDTRELLPLSELRLFDQLGKEGFLTAVYANNKEQPNQGLKQHEGQIDYTFLDDLEKIPADFNMADGAVTWTGQLMANHNGLHQFYLSYSGYIKIWIDGQLILDRWRESWNPGPAVFRQELHTDKPSSIKMEWIPESTQSFFSIKYLAPSAYDTEQTYAFQSEAGQMMDYYFIHGKSIDERIHGYRLLTGKAQVMPKWAMGFWQSRERYHTQAELLNTVAEYRKRGIPLDNIVQDWSYWPEAEWGSHDFDPERFPDPAAMVRKVHEEYHAQLMISVWPKFYEGIDHYEQFESKGWLYQQNIKNRQKDWIGQGYISTFYDAFAPGARELFWKQINDKLYQKGIDAWWLDATEPDIHSNSSIDHRKTLMSPNALGTSEEYFNAYSLVNAKGIYEGQRKQNNQDRVFILTRSGFPGIQRYGAATWSGDIAARFDELEQQIPAGLNFALSGLPYWTTDIGGFFVENKYDRPDPQGDDLEEWRELNTRWYQYGTFSPLYRSHGQYPYREVFNIAPDEHPAYKSIVFYNKLRYRLMPYLYSLTGKIHHDDYTLMRPLMMDFEDKEAKSIKDQFMFGPSLMINPIYQYKARSREVFFPDHTLWYDLLTGEKIEGGKTIEVAAPYDKIPIYVKAGSIIPFGPEISYTSEKPADPLHLWIYPGQNGKFELYEDEGINYNYENGFYSTINLLYNDAEKTLVIGERKGEFEGMLKSRTFIITLANKNSATALELDKESEQAKIIKYEGKEIIIKLSN
ncbi:alpha-xylosidase [Echinicola pacifica]|uniref:Alpha-xylosidase n=2 Tax=Echinicola pacifica TaxID=346377 RepID=A0A918QBA3_9BACT|nr:alpha-xylosidase [Echinicola pacifica]